MSLLSQFFEKRHKTSKNTQAHEENETIAQIFSTQFNIPKPVIQKKKPITKPIVEQKKVEPEPQNEQQSNIEDEDSQQALFHGSTGAYIQNRLRIEKPKKKQDAKTKEKKSRKTQKIAKPEQEEPIQEQLDEKIEQEKPENIEEPENLDSTVFVGNIPLTSTHKSIKQHFRKYGKVLKVWFRSIPVEASKIPKKGLHILKKYQEGADSMNAYVKFETIEEAKASCSANGSKIEDKNIKVTLCNQYDLDYETTIFIGNLPRKVKDQQLWDAFGGIGNVKSVRVIRSKDNLECIGIGYVRFETKEEMKKAISEMNGKEIGDRPMRIKKAVSKQRLQKKARKIQQNKKKKFSKSENVEKTGKGTKVREDKGSSFKANIFKNKNYDKTKPIAKKGKEFRSQRVEQKPWTARKQETVNNQSNEIIRSKFGFQGKKIMLE